LKILHPKAKKKFEGGFYCDKNDSDLEEEADEPAGEYFKEP
jgi:uncharacterized protein YfeS